MMQIVHIGDGNGRTRGLPPPSRATRCLNTPFTKIGVVSAIHHLRRRLKQPIGERRHLRANRANSFVRKTAMPDNARESLYMYSPCDYPFQAGEAWARCSRAERGDLWSS